MNARLSIGGSRDGYRLQTTPITAAAAAADGFIGPFTRAQIVALLWRAKSIKMVAEIGYTLSPIIVGDPDEPQSASMELVAPRTYSADGSSFVDVLEQEDFVISILESQQVQFGKVTSPQVAYFEVISNFSTGKTIYADESDGYWLAPSGLGCFTDSEGSTVSWQMANPYSTYPDGFLFTGDLQIQGTTISLSMVAGSAHSRRLSVDSASFVLTVEEWYPYATTTGAAAWDTSTGEIANGGPGE